ncbi:MAG: PhnD/SsuA/transferrin family substrate-binding protein [Nitriliruptorales bacterium]|nr:PhnD/SsuA/transferrin family substrate-binding protein [Nitriliruptorales bacterium]
MNTTQRERRSPSLWWVLVAVMALVLSACAADEEGDTAGESEDDVAEEQDESAAEEVEIEYSIQMPGVISYELNLPTLVADAAGFLAEEGIEIEDYVTGSGGTLRQAVIAGEFDFGLFATVHPVLARAGGSPWKTIFAAHEKEIFSLIVRSEIADEIQSVEDLAGRTVGFSEPGAGSWFMGLVYLRGAGLDPDTDLEYVSLGGDPGVIFTSLQEGRVDAFASWEPTTTRAINEGIAEPLVAIWEDEVHQEFVGERAQALVMIALEDSIEEDPEFYQRLVDAHTAALEWIHDAESDEIVQLVLGDSSTAELFEGLDEELVVEMIDRIRGGFGSGCLDREGYETELEILMRYEVVEEEVPFDEVADTRFAGEC